MQTATLEAPAASAPVVRPSLVHNCKPADFGLFELPELAPTCGGFMHTPNHLKTKEPSKKLRAEIKKFADADKQSGGAYIKVADCAKLMRFALKEEFPGVTFSVRSSSYSGGASVSVGWKDGPTTYEVERVLRYFEGRGPMDMTDYCPDVTQTLEGRRISFASDYIHTSRDNSREFLERVAAYYAAYTGWGVPNIKDEKSGAYFVWDEHESFEECRVRRCRNLAGRLSLAREEKPKPVYMPVDEAQRAADAQTAFVAVVGERAAYKFEYQRDWTWLTFDGAPNEGQKVAAKALGFRYSNKRGAWYAITHVDGESIARLLGDSPAPLDPEPAPAAQVPELPAPAPYMAPVVTTPEEARLQAAIQCASILRRKGDSMSEEIERKLNPSVALQRPTWKRANQAESSRDTGAKLQQIQGILYALADAWERDTVPPSLIKVRTRNVIEHVLQWPSFPGSLHDWTAKISDSLENAGIYSYNFDDAKRALTELQARVIEQKRPDETAQLIAAKERALIGRKFPGFFHTQAPVIERMLEEARIEAGDLVLEPSAGKGDIADAIRQYEPDALLNCVELQPALAEIVQLKGHAVHEGDFLEFAKRPEQQGIYKRILMNPPFEQLADVEHVRAAYKLLQVGGVLVAIMGEGAFFRKDSAARYFREWLEEQGGISEPLPEGSFKMSGTGVNSRLVVIHK